MNCSIFSGMSFKLVQMIISRIYLLCESIELKPAFVLNDKKKILQHLNREEKIKFICCPSCSIF
ncbi:hypothetical protein HZS_3517 [Henneguya salminicola]|nr:hypothetical protein HZS_3517 [Henneguya salminicola]